MIPPLFQPEFRSMRRAARFHAVAQLGCLLMSALLLLHAGITVAILVARRGWGWPAVVVGALCLAGGGVVLFCAWRRLQRWRSLERACKALLTTPP
jgi:hypothetical protein